MSEQVLKLQQKIGDVPRKSRKPKEKRRKSKSRRKVTKALQPIQEEDSDDTFGQSDTSQVDSRAPQSSGDPYLSVLMNQTTNSTIGPIETELISNAASDFLSRTSPRRLEGNKRRLVNDVLDYVSEQLVQVRYGVMPYACCVSFPCQMSTYILCIPRITPVVLQAQL